MLAGTLVGLVVVYHHHYDTTMLIPGLLLAVMLRRELGLSWSRWVTWSFVPIAILMAFVPAARVPETMSSIVGDRGPGLFNLCFPLATTLALAGSLALVIDSTGNLNDWREWIKSRPSLRRHPPTSRQTTASVPL